LAKVLPFIEDFTTDPSCWTQTYSGGVTSDRWSHSTTSQAEGTTGEMKAIWQKKIGTSRLISPLIRFDNVDSVSLSFKHYYHNDGPDVTIKLQCSSNLVDWIDLPFSHSGGNIAATTQTVQFVPIADSLYFAWTINGNHNHFYFWYIDDVSIEEVCLPKELPYSEDFTTSPYCWTQTYSGEIESDRWYYFSEGTEAGGTPGEMMAYWTVGSGTSRLISPLIRFNNATAVELSFKHYYDYSSSGVTIKLQCSPDLVTWTDLPFSHSEGDIDSTTQIVQFVPAEDSLYFAWTIDGNHYNFNYWYIDDVSITAMSSPCFIPVEIGCSNITATSIDITWVDPSSAISWEIEYGESGFIQGTGTSLSTTNNPTTISGLTPSTNYDFYIRAVCGLGEKSNWSPKQTFCTSQIPVEVPL